jgi:hypothetical protein
MICISARLMSWLSISWTPQRICNNTSRRSSLTVIVYLVSDLETDFRLLSLWRSHGYESKPRGDPFVTTVTRLIRIITEVLTPARAVVQMFFPFGRTLTRLGLCFVNIKNFSELAAIHFARGKKHDPDCRRLVKDVLDLPFEFVKKTNGEHVRVSCGCSNDCSVRHGV